MRSLSGLPSWLSLPGAGVREAGQAAPPSNSFLPALYLLLQHIPGLEMALAGGGDGGGVGLPLLLFPAVCTTALHLFYLLCPPHAFSLSLFPWAGGPSRASSVSLCGLNTQHMAWHMVDAQNIPFSSLWNDRSFFLYCPVSVLLCVLCLSPLMPPPPC